MHKKSSGEVLQLQRQKNEVMERQPRSRVGGTVGMDPGRAGPATGLQGWSSYCNFIPEQELCSTFSGPSDKVF